MEKYFQHVKQKLVNIHDIYNKFIKTNKKKAGYLVEKKSKGYE